MVRVWRPVCQHGRRTEGAATSSDCVVCAAHGAEITQASAAAGLSGRGGQGGGQERGGTAGAVRPSHVLWEARRIGSRSCPGIPREQWSCQIDRGQEDGLDISNAFTRARTRMDTTSWRVPLLASERPRYLGQLPSFGEQAAIGFASRVVPGVSHQRYTVRDRERQARPGKGTSRRPRLGARTHVSCSHRQKFLA